MSELQPSGEALSLKRLLVELGRLRSFRDPLAGLGALELTSAQAHAVAWLGHEGSLPVGVLAQRIGSPVPAATGVVDRLEKLGIVVRDRSDDDRRVVHVALTDDGRALYRELDHAICDGLTQLLAVLAPDDRRALLQILERLVSSLAHAREPSARPGAT